MTVRIAVAANDSLVSRYFLRTLSDHLPEGYTLELLLHETAAYPWRAQFHRFTKAAFPNFVRGYLTNPYWRLRFLEKRAYTFESTTLFGCRVPTLPEAVSRLRVGRIHDVESVEKLKKHDIDFLFIQGTLPIYSVVLQTVPQVIGLHFGLLPHYRGLHSQIWAAARGDRAGVAVTLYRVTTSLGGGEVLAWDRIDRDARLSLIALRALSIQRLCELVLVHLKDDSRPDSARMESARVDDPETLPPLLPPASLWTRFCAARHLCRWARQA